MINRYLSKFTPFLLAIICVLFVRTDLFSQLMLERELVGTVAVVGSVASTGGEQELLVDASFGETIIGYEDGDIIITCGFHQTEEIQNLPPPNLERVESGERAKFAVNAYPNPTIERLTVDLGKHREKFSQIRLIDVNGRTVRSKDVSDLQNMTFRGLDKLSDGNYFLQGVSKEGKLHQLSTVMIMTDSSN